MIYFSQLSLMLASPWSSQQGGVWLHHGRHLAGSKGLEKCKVRSGVSVRINSFGQN